MENMFLSNVSKHNAITENGALSNSSTNNVFADQFATVPTYRGREYLDVCGDQSLLWDNNPLMAMRFIFYLRMVTRKTKVKNDFVTEKVQNGQGVRDEAFKRLLWVAENHKDVFSKNIWLLPIVGSWKDIWQMMFYDVTLGVNAIDRNSMYELMMEAMNFEEHAELIKKFMPRIKSSSKLTTEWTRRMNQFAVEFADYLNLSKKRYNKLKASGKAHEFQKIICGGRFDEIKWNMIPGRALALLANSKFIEKHNLVDSYLEWLDKQEVAKFTGYPYELGKIFNQNRYGHLSLYKKHTLNKQFQSLIKTAKENGKITENVWCALDTSGSMTVPVSSTGVSAMDICMSLGIFFSTLNEGAFHKNVIMFDSTSRIKQLSGEFCDMMSQVPMNAMGSTNFMSVVDEIVRVRTENPNIPLEDYPKTLLIVSDMQFNPCVSFRADRGVMIQTNYEKMVMKLSEVFPEEFVKEMKFIWWNVSDRLKDFPSQITDGGTYMIGGFDGSVVSMLLGEDPKKPKAKKTMEDLVNDALNQEVLLLAEV